MSRVQPKISRRSMLTRTAQGAVTLLAAGTTLRLPASPIGLDRYRIWDLHAHLTGVSGTPEERIVRLLEYADRMAIERVIFFLSIPRNYDPTPQQFRRDNDDLLRALEAGGDRVLGFVYLNPKYTEESLRELDRCVRDGPMVGIKLWVALHCNDPRLDPIIRRATELNAVVFQHTWYKVGGKGSNDLNAKQMAEAGNLPGESTSEDLAELAARHPKAKLIAGHIGGDWERGIRAIRSATNVSAGIGGGDPTAGMLEMAVRELGAERIIYGSDIGGRSFASQLAKVYGANVSDQAKRMIFGANLRRLLQPILASKGIKVTP